MKTPKSETFSLSDFAKIYLTRKGYSKKKAWKAAREMRSGIKRIANGRSPYNLAERRLLKQGKLHSESYLATHRPTQETSKQNTTFNQN